MLKFDNFWMSYVMHVLQWQYWACGRACIYIYIYIVGMGGVCGAFGVGQRN